MRAFYSNGKLLLSGEYAVLDGAEAWAIPTKYGQTLRVSKNESNLLTWKSLDEKGHPWFTATYDKKALIEISCSDHSTSRTLLKLLRESQKLNPDFLSDSEGFEIETKLSFPKNWGLGSSSTLINNLAQWGQVDAYRLLWNAFSGSGYDLACAQTDFPIIYSLVNGKPCVREINTAPPFSNQLYFVYLNKKRNSREAIDAYRKLKIEKSKLVEEISALTHQMVNCSKINVFEHLVATHESVLSKALNVPTVKETLFSDYERSIKSLGAWGGDFILAVGDGGTPDYFQSKGYTTVIPFQKMIL